MIANITTRDKGGVIVVDVSGNLTLSEGARALREKILGACRNRVQTDPH